jgi:hypothetical protein
MKDCHAKTLFSRVIASFLLFVFALGLGVPLFLANPKPAHAQLSVPISDTQTTIVNIWDTLKDQFVGGAISALVNGANYFLSKLAYELAVSLTADCPGQVVCWDSKGFKEGFEESWKGAVGEVVETLSEEGGFSEIGLNLCNPDVDVSMRLQLGLLDEAEPPEEPRCNFDSFLDNWSSIGDQFSSEEVLGNFRDIFQPGNSELGISFSILDVNQGLKADAIREKGLSRLSEAAMGGFSDVTDPVSGRVKAPGSTVAKEYDRMKKEKEDDPRRTSESMSSGALARGAVMSVVMNFVQTFVQTFLGRLWNKFTDGLISTEEAIQSQPEIILSEEGLFRPPGKKSARQILTRMLTPVQKELGEVDPLLNFTVCPQQGRKPDNCVMDAQFSSAVRVAQATPFTVRQAIEEGYLHGEWPLISATDARNQDPHCYTQGYCESNLKKLRAARIIPIGWEIAASQARGVYAGIRLSDAVEAFDDCTAEGERDEFHPFCHLIDPNWILLAPAAQCRVSGYGPRLASPSISQRLEECVDYRTCLRQDDLGKCVGGWGYCTREKNVWRFNADSCPAEYNTCRTMTPAGGGTPVNYLLNTLDFGICDADNVGCAQYATNMNVVKCELSNVCEDEENGCPIVARVVNGRIAERGGRGICRLPDDENCAVAGGCLCGVVPDACTVAAGNFYCLLGGSIGSCSLSAPCSQTGGCYTGCVVANGQTTCNSSTGLDNITYDDWLTTPTRFFDNKIEACDAQDNGCSTLYQLNQGQSLNLVNNGSFERLDAAAGLTDWAAPSAPIAAGQTGEIVSGEEATIHGGHAVRLSRVGSRVMTRLLPMSVGQMHTASATFRSAVVDSSFRAQLAVTFYGASGAAVIPAGGVVAAPLFSEYIETYDPSSADFANPCGMNGAELLLDFNTGIDAAPEGEAIDQIRAACSFFITDNTIKFVALELRLPVGAANDVYADAIQFEQGPLTPYHEGYNTANMINAKVASTYLGCSGEVTDLAECSSFARVCRENEVGCKLFTPLNGDPAVPGIIGPQDYCPAECVGFDMFFQEPTDFEGPPEAPEHFIPATAEQCSAADVGCTAFTNVDTEAVEYYSRLRICQAPEAVDSKVYYTWEGSDTTGYQLRSWTLKRGGVESTSNITPSGLGAAENEQVMTDICADNRFGACASLDDEVLDSPGPCVKLAADNVTCNDNPEDRSGYCSRSDILRGDFDCREFYDSNGHRHYRRLAKTIIATADCHLYRITDSNVHDCPLWNGRWDAARGECIYSASPSWSYACSAAAAGCRSYRGNAASNVQTLFVDDFETELNGRWVGAGLAWSSESLVVGGHSIKVGPAGARREIGANVGENNLYSVSFWARGNGNLSADVVPGLGGRCPSAAADETVCADPTGCSCTNDDGLSCTIANGARNCIISPAAATIEPTIDPGSVILTSEWRHFEIGPFRIGNPGGAAGRISAALNLAVTAGGEVYLDNLIFKRVRDNITVVKKSWNTPLSCNRTREGIYSPLEMLGCRAYRGSDNQVYNLRSFSALCRPESAGCEAYSHTQNTPDVVGYKTYGAICNLGRRCGELAGDAPNCACNYAVPNPADRAHDFTLTDVCRVPLGQSTCRFNLDGLDVSTPAGVNYSDRFVLPADQRLYLVVAQQNRCAQTAVGCRNMGQPVIEFERQCKLTEECNIAAGCACQDFLTNESCSVETGKTTCQIPLAKGVIGSWKGAVVKDDPAKYEQTLCPVQAVGCNAYNAADGARYFKDPGNQVCQFRTNINYNGRKVSGWFRKSASGSIFPCYESFRRSGDIYDIYRNSDVQYTGWVGMCSAEYDRCEEFIDPLDTSSANNPNGKPYYYLDNSKLNKSSCQGQASLEEGCVLLKQTSNTQNLFSAAASYFRSSQEANGALVNAVNCDGSGAAENSACANRCHSVVNGTCNTASSDRCATDRACGAGRRCVDGRCRSLCNSNAECGVGGVCEGGDRWSTGCRVGADEDCNQAIGETCEEFTAAEHSPRNDSNVIIKVRRDRDCAEWLECDKSQPVYDSSLGRWINRCLSFSTCTAAAQVGESFVCSEIKDVPREIFTINDYVTRDIGWNGEEYAGYSIVDRYPLQYLQAFRTTSGQCRESGVAEPSLTTAEGRIIRCRDTEQCVRACSSGVVDCAEVDNVYCSAPLSGICVGGAQAGFSCERNEHCQGTDGVGYCSQSQFDVVKFGVQRSLCRDRAGGHYGEPCVQDTDCFDEPYPAFAIMRGACANSCTQNAVNADGNDGCPPDGNQPICSGDDCPETWGTCLENSCIYDYRGGPLLIDDILNAPSCRAYPEADSPFPANILDIAAPTAADAGATPGYNKFGNPVKLKAPYRGANTCHEGNSCDCFYSRIGYGQGGTKVRYQAFDNSIKYREAPSALRTEAPGVFRAGISSGVCMGGPFDGMSCTPGAVAPDEEGPCGPMGSGGTCMAYSSFALAAGWPGFCVDRDYSDRLYADPNIPGCNLWLPVDVIPGMTDMLSQHPEAGFNPVSGQIMYCAAAVGNGSRGSCSEDLNTECSTDEDCGENGPCNFYFRTFQKSEILDHVGWEHEEDEDVHGGIGSPLFQAFQDDDPDGDLMRNQRRIEGVFRSDIAEIVIIIGEDGESNQMYIVLNEENDFQFASHFDGNFPEGDDVIVADDGLKYVLNEVNTSPTANNCYRFFLGAGESYGDRDEGFADDGGSYGPWGTRNCLAVQTIFSRGGATVHTVLFTDRRSVADHDNGRALHVPVRNASVRLREICTEVDLVHNASSSPSSVPYTSRLYTLRSLGFYEWPSFISSIDNHTPFGAISPSTIDLLQPMSHGIPVVGADPSDEENYNRTAGSPFYSSRSISTEGVEELEIDPVLGVAVAAGYPFTCPVREGHEEDGLRTCRLPDAIYESEIAREYMLGEQVIPSDGVFPEPEGVRDLFALILTRYDLTPAHTGYELADGGEAIDNRLAAITDDEVRRMFAPRVLPVNTSSTLCRDQGNTCPEFGVVDGFSVNGMQRDMCFSGGNQSNVELAYYAYANSDHMPIRRHIIDFGDGTAPVRLDGSFKNTRGLRADGTQICGSDDTDFGLTADACDSRFMRFNKTYTCSESVANILPRCAGGSVFPCRDAAGCCVFKPLVQVLDNWGVCNGTCSNASPDPAISGRADGNLCINTSTVNYLDESRDRGDLINECTILSASDRNYRGAQPYVEYAGVIVVCPGNCTSDGMTGWASSCPVAERCMDGACGGGLICVEDCCVAP